MCEKISVIMSIYKESENELKSSIESILNQSYKNLEFIIIIDNPEEKWRINFLKSYKDERIKIIVNKKNIGLTNSLNKALKKVSGEFVARMDADDISLPNRLEKQYEFLKNTGYDMCGANVACFIDGSDFKNIKFPEKSESVNKLLFVKNCVSHPTFFVKRKIYEDLNGYNNIFACEDYDFLLRAIKKDVKIGNVQEILLRYRISPQSISRKNAGKQELIAKFLRNFYKKNDVNCVTENMIQSYIDSNKFKRKLKSFDYYWGMKNTRSKYKEKKGLRYYIYTLLLIFNLKHSIREIYVKLYERKISKNEIRG